MRPESAVLILLRKNYLTFFVPNILLTILIAYPANVLTSLPGTQYMIRTTLASITLPLEIA